MRIVLAALLAVAIAGAGDADADPVPVSGPACPNRPTAVPADRVAALARGVNLTGWLDARPGIAPSRDALRFLRTRGFTHLRLPIATELYLPDLAGESAASGQRRALALALDDLLGMGFAVSLDMHPGAEIGALRASDPERARALIDRLWASLAREHAVRSPDRLFFELLNEPTDAIEAGWLPGFARTVRAAAPNHTLVVGPALWQRIEALEAMRPLADRNVVYAIHVYDPMAFTHQGMDWAPEDDPLRAFRGVPYPTRPDHPAVLALERRLRADGRADAAAKLAEQLAEPWDAFRLETILARAERWALRAAAPVIVNEFGVLAWHAPAGDRARWLRDVRRAAERHCIGWTHWDYAQAFGLMRREEDGRETPDPAVLEALIGP